MHPSDIEWRIAPDRYSAKKMAKPVNFACFAPWAKQVTLAGEFNGWDATSHPMQPRPSGAWALELQLTHGHHQYLFYVDGRPMLDPKAVGTARHPEFGEVSLVSVS